MKHKTDNLMPDIPEHFMFRHIEPPDEFALKVMERIENSSKGGFSSFSTASKVVFLSLTLLIYSSLGVFIGVQSHKNSTMNLSYSKKKALIELKKVHHLDPVSSFDSMLHPFETKSN